MSELPLRFQVIQSVQGSALTRVYAGVRSGVSLDFLITKLTRREYDKSI